AKLYMNAEIYTGTPQWDKAEQHIDALINSGNFSLMGNYFDNFKTENSGSTEFIYAIPYDQVFAQGFNLVMRTLHYGSQETYNLTAQPWNGYCSLEEFYNSFEEDDIRRNSFIVGPQFKSNGDPVIDSGFDDPDGPQVNFKPFINELAPQAWRDAGARIGKFEFALGATPDLSNDFPVFRYSDVLLMKAEVLLRKGDEAGALVYVNMLRDRAGVAPFTTLTMDDLLAERGREMCFEAYRRQDLIRFGKYNDPWWEKPASDPTKNIYPIPRGQIDANKNLVQNPGYN
ncbi:MAG: RagB/SusD family nutrient uptake outer membrane protein, partial [Bacteroidetes bacterium]